MKYSQADQKLIDTVVNYKEIEYRGEDPLDIIEEALVSGADLFVKYENVDLLTYAVKRENLDLIEYLLSISYKGNKFDINAYIDSKDTVLTQTLRSVFAHPELAEILIKAGADVNKKDKESMSPLIIAVLHEKVSDVELLIDNGADINYLTPETKITPFLAACQGTSYAMVKKILDKGADINQVNPIGVNSIMLALNAFGLYATKEDKEQRKKIINLLLDNNIDVNTVAKSGLTALWSSIGSWKEMDRIVELGADLYAEYNLPQENIKPFAHRLMELQVVKIKPKYHNKGDENKDGKEKKVEELGIFADKTRKAIFADFRKGIPNSEGNTLEAICVANPLVVKNYKELLPHLMDIEVNQFYNNPITQTYQKKTKMPLITSLIANFSEDNIELLTSNWLNQGREINLYIDDKLVSIENQPIITCLTSGKTKTLINLTKSLKFDIDENYFYSNISKKEYHITEIFQKIISSSGLDKIQNELNQANVLLEAIEINKKNGVVSNILADQDKAKVQFEKKKKELESNLKVFMNYQEEAANTLVYLGVKFNHINKSGVPTLFSVDNQIVLELFEKMGANINQKATNGDNFLVNAMIEGNIKIIPVLVERWKNDNQDFLSSTLNQILYHGNLNDRVQQPIIEQSIDMLFSLYSKNVDDKIIVEYPYINNKDEDGNTPLLVAAANDYNYVMKRFINAGSDINAKNNNGETAIMHAIANENYAMVKFLLENKVDINVTNNDGVTIENLLEDLENKELIEMVESYINGEFNPDVSKVKFKKNIR